MTNEPTTEDVKRWMDIAKEVCPTHDRCYLCEPVQVMCAHDKNRQMAFGEMMGIAMALAKAELKGKANAR